MIERRHTAVIRGYIDVLNGLVSPKRKGKCTHLKVLKDGKRRFIDPVKAD
jgi:hypothetical protein